MSRRASPERAFRTKKPEPIRRAGTVALVGRANVGKSTLMNALLGEALAIVSPTPQTTRDRILGVVHHGDAQIGLLDTPGLHKAKTRLGKLMNSHAREAAKEADVVLFITDPQAGGDGPLKVREQDRVLLSDIPKDKPVLLILNKIDRVSPRSRMLGLLQRLHDDYSFEALIPIAARRNDGTERVLDEIASRMPEQPALFAEDELTDKPLRFFAKEFVREQILKVTHAEVPHACAVTVDSFAERGGNQRISATIHVEREGQKPILLGKGGTRIKEIGMAARERIAALTATPTHLKLFVRVTPGWPDNPAVLNEFGYGGGQK